MWLTRVACRLSGHPQRRIDINSNWTVCPCGDSYFAPKVEQQKVLNPLEAALAKAARDMVWTLYVRCPHDFEEHNLARIERYFVKRWMRNG